MGSAESAQAHSNRKTTHNLLWREDAELDSVDLFDGRRRVLEAVEPSTLSVHVSFFLYVFGIFYCMYPVYVCVLSVCPQPSVNSVRPFLPLERGNFPRAVGNCFKFPQLLAGELHCTKHSSVINLLLDTLDWLTPLKLSSRVSGDFSRSLLEGLHWDIQNK